MWYIALKETNLFVDMSRHFSLNQHVCLTLQMISDQAKGPAAATSTHPLIKGSSSGGQGVPQNTFVSLL
jgi:Tfp pilus assembly protein PilZ